MEKKKKTWTEPKLTALVRRKPEEGILFICKSGLDSGPRSIADDCREPDVCEWPCEGQVAT